MKINICCAIKRILKLFGLTFVTLFISMKFYNLKVFNRRVLHVKVFNVLTHILDMDIDCFNLLLPSGL